MSTHDRNPVRRGARPAGVRAAVLVCGLAAVAAPSAADAQAVDALEALVEEARASNPEVLAALRRAEAAAARVPQAGTLPDPMLSAGLMNLPVDRLDLSAEGMTMFSLQLEQSFLPRGLRAARRAAAEADAEAAGAEVEIVRWSVATRLREAYYELLLVDEAEEVHHRTHAALEAFADAAQNAYGQGRAPQADVLRAQTELAAIHEHLSELRQRRSAALAEVNALLGRESRAPVRPAAPRRLLAVLEADPGPGLFSASLAGGEIGGPFPALLELQARAVRLRPELALAERRERAALLREEAARRDRSPGITVMGGYGARSGRHDLISIGASVALPVFRNRKQDPAISEAGHERRSVELEREGTLLEVRREVAEGHAAVVRARDRLILLDEAVIPPAGAAVESAAAAYRTGDMDFTSLLQAQAALYRYEIERAHLMAELGQALARLEQAVGFELTLEDDR